MQEVSKFSGGDLHTMKIGFLLTEGFDLLSLATAIQPLRFANHVAGFQLCEWKVLSLEGGTLNASSGIATATTRLDHTHSFNVLILCTAENIRSDTNYDVIRRQLDYWASEPVDLGAFGGAGWLLAMSGALNGFRCSLPNIGNSQNLRIFKDITFVGAPFCVDRGRLTCVGGHAVQGLMCEFLTQKYGKNIVLKIEKHLAVRF